jgi:hypothetical protein
MMKLKNKTKQNKIEKKSIILINSDLYGEKNDFPSSMNSY